MEKLKSKMNVQLFKTYLLVPLILSVSLAVIPGLFMLIGFIQFIVAALQLMFTTGLSLYVLLSKKQFDVKLKQYWLMVIIYFIIMLVFGYLFSLFEYHDITRRIACFYIGSAWVIAIYHFKHILFLKLK